MSDQPHDDRCGANLAGTRSWRPVAQVRAVAGPYVDQVVTEFLALPPDAAALPRFADAQRLVARRDELDWQELFTLELWLLQLMPLHQLEARAQTLEQGHPSGQRPAAAVSDYEAKLRGWAVNALTERQWAFRKNLLREQEGWRLRRRLKETLIIASLAASGVGALATLFGATGVSLIALIAWLGIAGGYASVNWRAYRLGARRPAGTENGDALSDLCALDVGQDGIVTSMLLGGLFAVIGHFLLASGLVQVIFSPSVAGALLPNFGSAVDPSESSYLAWLAPAKAPDFARLVVWSFLFGFAERLVPDVLDRLSGRVTAAGRNKGAGVRPMNS